MYDGLLRALYFPRYNLFYNLSVNPRHYSSIAIELTTLQQDAREIAGEDMYSFLLPPSHQQGAFQELAVYLECRRMEIKVTHVKEDALRFLTFSKIDAEKNTTIAQRVRLPRNRNCIEGYVQCIVHSRTVRYILANPLA